MIDNDIVYQARLHWILFLGPLALLCLGVFVGFYVMRLQELAIFFMILAFIWGIMAWIRYESSSLVIKKTHIILHTGILVRETLDISLSKIESIDIRRSLCGSLLHYGSLIITGTGGSRQLINYLNKPLTCRRYIEQLMHAKPSS